LLQAFAINFTFQEYSAAAVGCRLASSAVRCAVRVSAMWMTAKIDDVKQSTRGVRMDRCGASFLLQIIPR
jgi:hypothetical protein